MSDECDFRPKNRANDRRDLLRAAEMIDEATERFHAADGSEEQDCGTCEGGRGTLNGLTCQECGGCGRVPTPKQQELLKLFVEQTNREMLAKAPPSGKKDSGKIRPELVDPAFIMGVAAVATMGAAKYSAGGWMGGMDYSRLYGAAQRHLMAWWSGQEEDEESGLCHLYHAAWSLMALAAYQGQAPPDTGSEWDDRGRITPADPDIETTMKD